MSATTCWAACGTSSGKRWPPIYATKPKSNGKLNSHENLSRLRPRRIRIQGTDQVLSDGSRARSARFRHALDGNGRLSALHPPGGRGRGGGEMRTGDCAGGL